jgi:hypothetical protein
MYKTLKGDIMRLERDLVLVLANEDNKGYVPVAILKQASDSEHGGIEVLGAYYVQEKELSVHTNDLYDYLKNITNEYR